MTRRVLLVIWDALGWAAALALASSLRNDFGLGDIESRPFLTIVLVAVVGQLAVGAALQTYGGRHPIGDIDEVVAVAAGTALTGSVVFLVDFFVQPQLVPRSVPLLAVPIAVVIAWGSRLTVRLYRRRRYRADYSRARRVMVLGAGVEGQYLLRSMLADPAGRYLPVALLDDSRVRRRYRISGVEVRGTRADIAMAAAESDADLLVIADGSLPGDAVEDVAGAARDAGLQVARLRSLDELLMPVFGEQPIPAPRTAAGAASDDPGGHRTDREVDRTGAPPHSAALSKSKRGLDVLLCLMALVFLLPVMLLIAVVLKATAGEVIYRAPRVGRDGQPFTMFKFVTMTRGDTGPRVTRRGDLRVTGVGRWLRETKLNELPQIVNVLKGDMSIVGPRPEDPRYAAHYADHHRPVLAVRPGMTSLAFLRFGDEEAFIANARPHDVEAFYIEELLPKKLDIELDYVTRWSIREDLRILAGTVRTLLC